MEQKHANNAIRHAEKRRNGTCQFANRVATISLEAYKSTVPKIHREEIKQTCVAAIVAHYSKNNSILKGDGNEIGTLRVLGLGVGTKFVSHSTIIEEQTNLNDSCYGKRLRDCHAEVLARRAFRRHVALEVLKDLKTSNYCNIAADDDHNHDYEDNSDDSILERVECKDDEMETLTHYRLKPNVTIHFYTSSAPCGNATLKKFVKMEKEVFDASLVSFSCVIEIISLRCLFLSCLTCTHRRQGPDEWPLSLHKPVPAHSLRLGQFALLVKKDGSASLSKDEDVLVKTVSTGEITTQQLEKCNEREVDQPRKKKKTKIWPCRVDDAWCPPSCSITNYGRGTIHTCSDKICRWNCVGLQGSLLMPLLETPIYMTTMTVGRKFSRSICQRAVCCRAEGFHCSSDDKFKLNHPSLMETNVYMDESGTHQMEGIKAIGEDASFDSTLCWVWWSGKSSNSADCIDGKTGFIVPNCDGDSADKTAYSEVCTYALLKINFEIFRLLGHPIETSFVDEKLSLSALRSIKRKLSTQYESAKDGFLLRHRVFRGWCCRERRVNL